MQRVAEFFILVLAGLGAVLLASFLGTAETVPAGEQLAAGGIVVEGAALLQGVESEPAGPPAEFPVCADFPNRVLPDFFYLERVHAPPYYARVQVEYPAPTIRDRLSLNLDTRFDDYPPPREAEAAGGENLTRQAAVLMVDLAGEPEVWLIFEARNWLDEYHSEDGIYISEDGGASWKRILILNDLTSEYEEFYIDLVQAAADTGIHLVDNFQIKFQSVGSEAIPDDGFSFDDICVRPLIRAIDFNLTVGVEPGVCGPADEITAAIGTEITYCYRVTNTGEVTFTQHHLEDSIFGPLLQDFPQVLAPGEQYTLLHTAVLTAAELHTATWTAFNPGPTDVVSVTDVLEANVVASTTMPTCLDFEDSGLPAYVYTDTIDAPPAYGRVRIMDQFPAPGGAEHSLGLDTNCNDCGGDTVQSATIVLDLAGEPQAWLDYWMLRHAPGNWWENGVFISDDSGVSWSRISPPAGSQGFEHYEHFTVDMVQAAADTGRELVDGFQVRLLTRTDRSIPVQGFSFDQVCTRPIRTDIKVTKGVGLDPAECAPANFTFTDAFPADVTYCYKVENMGEVTYTTHHVSDDHLGVLWDDVPFTLGPGESVWFTQTVTLAEPTTNWVTWSAFDDQGEFSAYGLARAWVTERPTSAELSGLAGREPGAAGSWWFVAAALLLLTAGGWLVRKQHKL